MLSETIQSWKDKYWFHIYITRLKGNVQFIDVGTRMRVIRGEGEGRMGDLFLKYGVSVL